MEISTKDNETRVAAVYERAMQAVHRGKAITAQDNLIYQIECLSQEVNSGASFEQYFRWVGKAEVDQILSLIDQIDIPPVYTIVQEAIQVAFPHGVPEDEDEYEECTDWNAAQKKQLEELFEKFEQYNGVIMNKLGQLIAANDGL